MIIVMMVCDVMRVSSLAQLHHYIRNVHPHLPPLFINVYAKKFKKFQG